MSLNGGECVYFIYGKFGFLFCVISSFGPLLSGNFYFSLLTSGNFLCFRYPNLFSGMCIKKYFFNLCLTLQFVLVSFFEQMFLIPMSLDL